MSIYDKASLVLIPSGTKTSKVYSQKPVNGDGDFTFSRSTAATRVNADGNIEKETQNLLLQSNTLILLGTIHLLRQAVKSDTMELMMLGYYQVLRQVAYANQLYRIWCQTLVYAKAGTLNWCLLITQVSQHVDFDLSNGAIGYMQVY